MPTSLTKPNAIGKTLRAVLIAFATLTMALPAHAEPPAGAAHAEIMSLLDRLQASACQFNRNGTWYSPADAKNHLTRKLDYLEGKNKAQSTEQFIELGASSSSMSGKAYLVKCGSAPAVESKAWLTAQLKTIRSEAAAHH